MIEELCIAKQRYYEPELIKIILKSFEWCHMIDLAKDPRFWLPRALLMAREVYLLLSRAPNELVAVRELVQRIALIYLVRFD